MAINNVGVGSTDTTLVEVPAGKVYAITTIIVCNTIVPNPYDENDGLTNFDMHFVKDTEPKSDTNKVINALELPAGETFTFNTQRIILDEGDKVVLLGESPTVLSATISWIEV